MAITYQQRHKDIVAHTIVEDRDDNGNLRSLEIYGKELDGTTVWVWVHTPPDCEIKEPYNPKCAVCGGPFPDGSGCEFCPDIQPQPETGSEKGQQCPKS